MLIAITVVIIGLAIALAMAFSPKASGITFEERLKQMAKNPEKIDLTELELSKPFSERVIFPIVEKFGNIVAKITPAEVVKETVHKIQQSGMKIKPGVFITCQVAMAVIFPALLGLLGVMQKAGGLKGVGMLVFSGLLGYFMPDLWLKGKVGARKGEIIRKLPDALDLLTVSVEAGLGFDMALNKVVEKFKGPLTEEFAKVLHEIRLGKPRRDSLKSMSTRVDAPDLTSFISALVQADKLGVSIANVLRVQSDQMRLRRRQRAEETAMKAPLKMSFVLVFFVLPALMIVLLGPAAISVIIQLSGNEAL